MHDSHLATTPPQSHDNFRPSPNAATVLHELAVVSSTSFSRTADAITAYLNLVMRLVGVRSAFVAQLDERFMRVLDAVDVGGCGIPADGVLPLEQTFCQYVRVARKPVVVTDAAQDVRVADVQSRTDYTIGAYAGVPIMLLDGTVYGTLCALDPTPRSFPPEHVALMEIAAQHLGRLIEREFMVHQERLSEQDTLMTLTVIEQQRTILQVAAHELRTPLTTICGYVDMLQSEMFGQLMPKQEPVLNTIADAAQLATRMLTDLVDAAAIDQHTVTLVTLAFDPATIAQIVVEACQPEAFAKDRTIQLRAASTAPRIVGDPDRLQQILLNFVRNALGHTSAGTITIQVQPHGEKDERVEFRVIDTGPGIPEDKQDKIWQPYTRLSTTGPGFGLGLYVAQQLAEAMGGTIGVTSVVDQGSHFWLQLPVTGPTPRRATLSPAI